MLGGGGYLMKTNELRTTLLIIAAVLLAVFLLGGWWVQRQAKLLQEIKTDLATSKTKLIASKEAVKTEEMILAVIRAEQLSWNRRIAAEPKINIGGALLSVKRGFNDIEHHVAKGEFPGLALTDGYVELRELLENPAFEEMLPTIHVSAP
jgi:hypothetical protein